MKTPFHSSLYHRLFTESMRRNALYAAAVTLLSSSILYAEEGETNEKESSEPATTQTTEEAQPDLLGQASRYIFTEPEEYIEAVTQSLRMHGEVVCPFGLPQEDLGIAQTTTEKELFKAEEKEKSISLSEILRRFPVNAVSAKKGMIFSGKRIYKRNQKLKIVHDGNPYRLQILKISTRSVLFKNLENGETAVKSLKVGAKRIKRSYKNKSLRTKLRKFSSSEKAIKL